MDSNTYVNRPAEGGGRTKIPAELVPEEDLNGRESLGTVTMVHEGDNPKTVVRHVVRKDV